MNTARTTGLLAHGSRSFVDWFTGTGFLTVNALAFFTALVVLIPWNVYSSPGDFWTAGILVRWAFLLGFHALLVGVWSLIRNVILKDDNPMAQMTPTDRQWQAARMRASGSTISFHTPPSTNPVVTSTASALLAEEWARQWVDGNGSPAEREEAPSPEEAQNAGSVDISELLADWDTSWPEPHQTDDAQEIHPVESPQPEDAHPGPDGRPSFRPPERIPGPLTAAARAAAQAPDEEAGVDPDLEWQWIEAAATSWLSRRETASHDGHGDSGAPS